jgi:hypothetical protein
MNKTFGLDRNTCLALMIIAMVAGEAFKVLPGDVANPIIVGCFALFNPHPGA